MERADVFVLRYNVAKKLLKYHNISSKIPHDILINFKNNDGNNIIYTHVKPPVPPTPKKTKSIVFNELLLILMGVSVETLVCLSKL